MSDCTGRDVGCHWKQIVRKSRGQRLGVLVILHPLQQCVADAVGDAALHLAIDDHRIDDVAAIVRHRIVENFDGSCAHIHFNLRHMRPTAVGSLRWREIGGMFEAYRLTGVQRKPRHALRGARKLSK